MHDMTAQIYCHIFQALAGLILDRDGGNADNPIDQQKAYQGENTQG
jgi:hypothetical protein